MKKTIIAGGLAAVSLAALIGGAALAQQAPDARPARGAAPVNQDEFVQARVSRLTALDTNRDGTVSADEMRVGVEARHAERASQRFERLDADKNGQISRAEFDAPRAPHGARAGLRGPRDGERHGQRMGADGERGGTARGVARHGPVVIADVQTKLTENFARRDTNHDGVLSPDERRAGRLALRNDRRQHRAERMGRSGPRAPAPNSTSPSAPASE